MFWQNSQLFCRLVCRLMCDNYNRVWVAAWQLLHWTHLCSYQRTGKTQTRRLGHHQCVHQSQVWYMIHTQQQRHNNTPTLMAPISSFVLNWRHNKHHQSYQFFGKIQSSHFSRYIGQKCACMDDKIHKNCRIHVNWSYF